MPYELHSSAPYFKVEPRNSPHFTYLTDLLPIYNVFILMILSSALQLRDVSSWKDFLIRDECINIIDGATCDTNTNTSTTGFYSFLGASTLRRNHPDPSWAH